ncbi:MAG TPA: V-type ATP synthase subunit D [Bacteroidales bacterium]|nr:V-type ATP synthase subunit D [Bacteroidales bacterium]HRR48954.1 V-type ATP synthase subunit D [Bacteroidales bacterium]HRT33421.1 V-type ATP synthase subunit D [Bacteroidales bacterium]HRT83479.1 V-type ATP synthase subunit D [Bacteroidales bacterium]
MAIKFQFNKTSLNDLNKQLKIRTNALPTLKNKESALRFEVKRAKYRSDELANRLESVLRSYQHICGLWNEFRPDLIKVKDVNLETVKVAGVKTPSLKEIIFEETPFNFFTQPFWYNEGINILKELSSLGIESEIYREKMRLLDFSRKKTTQKVNLYEKVQIPGYQEAILKIKRFIEDEENLSKASQKIVKNRHIAEEEGI